MLPNNDAGSSRVDDLKAPPVQNNELTNETSSSRREMSTSS